MHIRLQGFTVLFLSALVAGTVPASALPFSFPNAEFMREDQGLQAAQDFVKTELPAGLAMSAAVTKVERARAKCRRRAGLTVVTCSYFIAAHPAQGDSGEDVWTVTLVPDASGALQRANVVRTHSGL